MKYFKGHACNDGWEERESEEARKNRGLGWTVFSHRLIAQAGMACENCNITLQELWLKGWQLEVHHKIKLRCRRELRFEPSNCEVLCQKCHKKAEKLSDALVAFNVEAWDQIPIELNETGKQSQ